MKKNNGFTLVELIAVIVIMGIIFIITIPQIQKTSINSKIKLCQNKLSLIEDSLNLFLSTNQKCYDDSKNNCYICTETKNGNHYSEWTWIEPVWWYCNPGTDELPHNRLRQGFRSRKIFQTFIPKTGYETEYHRNMSGRALDHGSCKRRIWNCTGTGGWFTGWNIYSYSFY